MPHISTRVSNILEAGKSGWEVHFEALKRKRAGDDIIMLSVGDHDFRTPEPSVEACIAALRAGHHHYTDLSGLPLLRAAMARASERSTGVATSPAEVIATAGGQGALFAAMQAAADYGVHGIMIAPHYAVYPGTFRGAGLTYSIVEALPEDDFQPRREALEAAVTPKTQVLLINSPNNPTGAIYSRETIEGISRFCIEHDLWLISDEVYWTHAEGAHVSPISIPGMAERTLVVNSVSKSHGMTGWRVGWLRGPADIIKKLDSLNLVTTYGLADFVSRAAAEALDKGYGVEQIAARYAGRRERFRRAFDGSNGVSVRGSKGGMYAMLDIRAIDPDGERFAFGLLEAEGVAVMPGESFGNAAAGHLRISLVQEDAVLDEAIARIKRFIAARAMAA
ncbi:MAG TPA: pyridoxal phosphate-dependent aminotransferase [Rhizobiaceae bacterium]|nr:pyridoxal phosphate-dependent aminotransferase [Rhizobiaceae bacterium]